MGLVEQIRSEIKTDKKENARYWDEIDNTIEKALKKIKGMSFTPTVDTDFYGDGILPELREKIIAYFKDKGGDYPYVNEDM